MRATVRIDDISSNTDFTALASMQNALRTRFPCDIWLCMNPFSRRSLEGSVYPKPPFKDQPKEFFYNVNQHLDTSRLSLGQVQVVSHGLFHADHSNLQYDAQEMSIVGSCKLLGANIFVPPFNRFNETTEAVCRHYDIKLVRSDLEGWRSLEHEPFDPSHKLWYFHAWRFTPETFKEALEDRHVSAKSV